jgi:hypothetical protein
MRGWIQRFAEALERAFDWDGCSCNTEIVPCAWCESIIKDAEEEINRDLAK